MTAVHFCRYMVFRQIRSDIMCTTSETMCSASRFIHQCWIGITLMLAVNIVFSQGAQLPLADFQTGWMPIRNGLRHIARIDIPHGLNEVPVIVDVAVKDGEHILPASGFRPDHGVEMPGPVVYIYNDKFINVSTSPYLDSLYQIKPEPTQFSSGRRQKEALNFRPWYVRVRAWKESSFPTPSYKAAGFIQAGTGSVSDSYKQVRHSDFKNKVMPCLVIVRAKMSQPNNNVTIYADGVGSSMSFYNNVPGKTNAFLVYGYSATHVRVWVDASPNGALFDGRKHTWFDFVIYEGEYEITVWSFDHLSPQFMARVETKHTMATLPDWSNVLVDYEMKNALLRVEVQAEDESGPNKGFRFPASMYLGYPTDRSDGYRTVIGQIGGLSYSTKENQVFFWSPRQPNNSRVFIGSTFGGGRNVESSNTESVYMLSWLERDVGTTGCKPPIIYKAYTDGFKDVSPVSSSYIVECMPGYHIDRNKFYSPLICGKHGHWNNVPQCEEDKKQLWETCYPVEDACQDLLASCVLNDDKSDYHCVCNEGYTEDVSFTHCVKATGQFLPKADFDSGWVFVDLSEQAINKRFEHQLGGTPMLVDVSIKCDGYVFPMLSFPPEADNDDQQVAAVYIYDDKYINITGGVNIPESMVADHNTRWTGWSKQWPKFGDIRARAWKFSSLPNPDFVSNATQLRANTVSSGSGSFAEVFHQLGEYPGLIQVRAKTVHSGNTFYAHGVGSALNVYNDNPYKSNAYLVYGFSNESVRLWVESSEYGAIFDRNGIFNFSIYEATAEIFIWKVATIVPYVTYKVPLHNYDVPNSVNLHAPKYEAAGSALQMAWVEIDEPNSVHYGYRFPGSTFLAHRFESHRNTSDSQDCAFGGFMYGITADRNRYHKTNGMILFKPTNPIYNTYNYTHGVVVCVPSSFGNGQYTGWANNGVVRLYSWLDPDCGQPAIPHGQVDTSNGTYIGAVAIVTCDHGYALYWKNFIECQSDGAWSYSNSQFDFCDHVVCEWPAEPIKGSMHSNDTTPDRGKVRFGQTLSFECDDGFELIGNNTIECLADGTWSDHPPICQCPLPPAPGNGSMTVERVDGRVMNVSFACNSNFELVGSEEVVCNSIGLWSNDTPICEMKINVPISRSSTVSVSVVVYTVLMIIMSVLCF